MCARDCGDRTINNVSALNASVGLDTHTQSGGTANILEISETHLSTAELQEYVDVFLVFEIMREFHHVLVRQRSVQLDLICDLPTLNNSLVGIIVHFCFEFCNYARHKSGQVRA